MYKFLLWDIDGTILDFLASEEYAIKALFRKFGLGDCTDEMIKLYSKINVKYWEALERNEITKQEVLIGRFLEFFEIVGVDKSIAEDFNNDYQLTLGDHLAFIDNAEKVLSDQKGKYVLIGVTNGTKVAQTKKLRQSGLDKVLDAVFISEDVGYEKPNVEFFNHVFREMGIKDKSEVLLIGDSLTSDMVGGVNAGIDTCWFNSMHKPNTRNIDITYEIDNLVKINEILV